MTYIHRAIEPVIKEYLTAFPVIGLTGPRQSGKSTLLQSILKKYTYVTFDDYKLRSLFEHDPEKFMSIYESEVIFDEVQKVPEIFNYIKMAVDRDRQHYGKFVLTGSNQFAFLQNITESLAGRMGLLSLLPFQYSEIPKIMREEAIYRGSYPELVMREYQHSKAWYTSYVDTYLMKDVRQISNIGDIRDFQRFMNLLAANTAQILDLTHYANDLGVAVNTIKRWLSVLEASYIIFLLPPFYENYGKRIVKSPKVYFYDTGLVAFLTGITTKELYLHGPMAGSLFENYIVAEIAKKESHQKTNAHLYYLRTTHGVEVDLIVDRKMSKEFIEIKLSSTFKPRMVKAVEAFISNKDKGYLLYTGENFPYKPITVVNYKDYLD